MTDDIATLIANGAKLRTRDRRDIVDLTVDADGIGGSVPMVGPCRWHRDGRLLGSPGGSAGPLDLVPAPNPASAPNRASIQEALSDPLARNSCCD
ncbi:hypothetical protein [Dongia sp.]|uniref:hypothetical protein n=1 Tax=Dongia sp. TaxID=1977262 RepID=UPI0035B4AD61